MPDDEEKRRQEAAQAAALLGVPTGESLSRGSVDDIEFSAKQQKRPGGMSRAEYMKSGPGRETQNLVGIAGLDKGRKAAWVAAGILAAIAGCGLIVWLVISS